MDNPSPRRAGNPTSVGLVTLLYLLFTGVMTWPLARSLNAAIPGDGFDGWQNYWNLWWVKVALVDRLQSPFQTDLLYYPTGVDLYFHTLNPFNGLATLPIQLSGGLLLAYNGVVFLSWTLAGLGVFLLTRWVLRPKNSVNSYPFSSPRASTGSASGELNGYLNSKPQFWLHQLLPPFLAGLIFTFAPFHMAHLLGHMQVMSLQWIPFYVLYLLRTLDQKRRGQGWVRSAGLAGLFLALCGLCDWYFVLYLFFFTGLLIGWHLLGDLVRSIRLRKLNLAALVMTWVVPPAVAGLLFFLLLSPILLPMIRTASELSFMVRPASDFIMLSASVADFLIPNRLHTLFREASFGWVGNQIAPVSERTISIGYLALLLAGTGLVVDRKRAGFWAASILFFFALALGPTMHLGNINWCDIPADLAEGLPRPAEGCPLLEAGVGSALSLFGFLNRTVPFMEISRSVSRYALMVQLGVAVLAGVGLSGLLTKRGDRQEAGGQMQGKMAAWLLLPAIVLAEYWVAPFPMSPPDTPAIYQQLADEGVDPDSGALLNLPMNYDRPGYLLYQTVHQRPLAIAYISREDPRTLTERLPLLQHLRHLGPDILAVDPARVGMTILQRLHIDYVTLDRYKMPGGLERTYTTELAQAIFGEDALIFEDDRMTVYRVPEATAGSQVPYPALGPLYWGALQETADGTLYRTILNGPAELMLHWGDGGVSSAQLLVQYQTADGAIAHVTVDGSQPIPLPPAVTSQTITIPLSVPQTALMTQPTVVIFYADMAETLYIESVNFQVE